MERNAFQTLHLIRTIIERCAVCVVGFSILMLIVSYHPDAATEHLEVQYQNKAQGLATQGDSWLAKLKHSMMQEVGLSPATPDAPQKPSVRLAHTAEYFSPVPEAISEPLGSSPVPETAATTISNPERSFTQGGSNSWLQTLKNALPWNRNSPGLKATLPLPSLVDKPVASVVTAPASASAARRANFTTVPMSFEPKALFVKVNVNDRSSGHFILDTGATYTTISRKMANELGLDLRHSETIAITTANGELKVPKVRLKTVQVNDIVAHDVEATVMDFESNASFSGLLGLSFIQHFKLTLDPQNGQMRFEPLR